MSHPPPIPNHRLRYALPDCTPDCARALLSRPLIVASQLASDEYLPLSTLIEGVVILRKNPNHVPDTAIKK